MSSTPPSRTSEISLAGSDSTRTSWVPSLKQFFLLLFSYFALQTLLRGVVSEAAGIDDCDQIIRAQMWSWGYGPQPPLYTWLLKIFLTLFGYNIYAVTVLKELALFGIYVLTYANARLITRSHLCGIAAAVVIQFNPSICWESHRELTHSILTSLFVLATIFTFLRLSSGRWSYYILFGACAGLGTLSKPNYLFFFGALLLAAISLKETRSVVLGKKMLVALMLFALICLPTLNWVLAHRELAGSSLHKFKMGQGATNGMSIGKVFFKWITDLVAHLGPTLGIIALIFAGALFKPKSSTTEDKLLWRTFLAILLLTTVSIVAFKVTGFRDRWLQPLFVWIPILLIAVMREQLIPWRYKTIIGLGTTIAVIVAIVAPGRMFLTERLKKNEILNSPYRELAEQLKPLVQNADAIVVGDYRVAGNLRLWFPGKFITSPEFADLYSHLDGRAILVWENSTDTPPAKGLLEFAKTVTGKQGTGERHAVEHVLKYHRARTMRLGVVPLE